MIKKQKGRKSEIIKAARELFQTKEYTKTTLQDVMDALGIAKGTIYHYFKSKEALFKAVIEDIVEKNIKHMHAIVKKSKGTALEKMKLLVQAGRMTQENKDIVDYLHRPENSAMHNQLLAAVLVKQAPLYAKLIQQGCEEGLFETEAPLECAEFILSGIQFLTDVGIYPWTKADLKRRTQAFPRLVEQQLQAPPRSFQFLFE